MKKDVYGFFIIIPVLLVEVVIVVGIFITAIKLFFYLNEVDSFEKQVLLISSLIEEDMSEKEKAFIIWKYLTDNTRHHCVAGTADPIKLLEVGYGCCDETARALSSLWDVAGLRSRVCYFV